MIDIRPERPADIDSIRVVHTASFPTPAEARLVDLLRDAGHLRVSLVAEIGEQIVGHVGFSPVTVGSEFTGSPASVPLGIGLAPVAVLAEFRKQGVAAALIRAGLAECQEAGFGWIVVLGDPQYYRRYGFRPASIWGLSDEYGGGEAFQALELSPQAIPTGSGLVKYSEKFDCFA